MTTTDNARPNRPYGVASVPPPVNLGVPPTGSGGHDTKVYPVTPQRTRSERHRRSGHRGFVARVRTIVVVVVLLGVAGASGYQIIRHRLADQAFVNLGSVVLTADAVAVGFAEAVVVNTVSVAQHARVTAGQELATVTTAVGGKETLKAPVAGTVAAIKVGVGGVARGGEPVVTLYDQARLTFQAEVPLPELRRMRLGMTAYIEGPGLGKRVIAKLDHVVVVVGADQTTTDKLTVVLLPTAAERATVSTLVPGLRFNAKVDTNTAPGAVAAGNTG
jgi:hypothetical protein